MQSCTLLLAPVHLVNPLLEQLELFIAGDSTPDMAPSIDQSK